MSNIKTTLTAKTSLISRLIRSQYIKVGGGSDNQKGSLPYFDYDAVIFLGSSSIETLAKNEADIQSYWASNVNEQGFTKEVVPYFTGLSGHTTDGVTSAWLGDPDVPKVPNRTLADYETLLAGKKVLVVNMIGSNDIKLGIAKADVALYNSAIERLSSAINSSSLNIEMAMTDLPYTDWSTSADQYQPDVFDIIEGSKPNFDQQLWFNDVVLPKFESLSTDWLHNGRPIIDYYTITRNRFRFYLGDLDRNHASESSKYLVTNYTMNIFSDLMRGRTPAVEQLYTYPAASQFAVGDKCIVSFELPWVTQMLDVDSDLPTLATLNTAINRHAGVDGLRDVPVLRSINNKYLGGRSYIRTSATNTAVSSGNKQNAEDASATLSNNYMNKSSTFVWRTEADKVISLQGIPSGTYKLTATSAHFGGSLKLTDGNVEILMESTSVGAGEVPKTASETFTVNNTEELTLQLLSADGVKTGSISGLEIERMS